ncbi:MAG: glycoside hydrolase family 3 N-terminal domain-containing protein [Patescibacteria group bacterium]|jgi:beta-glucosidase
MKYLYILIAGILLLGIFFLVPKNNKDVGLVDVCQDRTTAGCKIDKLPYNNQELSIDDRVNDLLKRMTLQEKIGQMMLIERNSLKNDNDIALYGLGGLLSGMGSKPEINTPEGWLLMVNEYTRLSRTTRLGIPVIYGADAIHGHTNIEKATVFPHFIGLGATGDAELVKQVALATTQELVASGVYWNFSPNVDVLGDPRWGRFFESFGSDPSLVTKLGTAYLDGIASYDASPYHPIGTAKHFVGAGAMVWGKSYNENFKIDQGESEMTMEELRQRHLPSFEEAIKAGVSSVMVGLNSWQNKKLSENKYLITEVLKKELGFSGFVVSDWYGVYEIEKNKYNSAVKAVNAGIDMIMLPFEYDTFMADMQTAVKKGDVSQERIDDAVGRILKVKFQIGLFDNAPQNADALQNIGSAEHRKLAREAVSKSLVVLKNEKQLLPISKSLKKIYVAGEGADNLGMQLGGWSVEWQGIDGNWTPGTTILGGIREIVSAQADLIYDKDGNFDSKNGLADVGIAVIGEKPYAEGWGDQENLNLSQKDLETIEKLKKNSKKLVVIIISGRPLEIKNEIKNWDAAVATWLPGSEGAGVADVIFGLQPITGKLPVDWPL